MMARMVDVGEEGGEKQRRGNPHVEQTNAACLMT